MAVRTVVAVLCASLAMATGEVARNAQQASFVVNTASAYADLVLSSAKERAAFEHSVVSVLGSALGAEHDKLAVASLAKVAVPAEARRLQSISGAYTALKINFHLICGSHDDCDPEKAAINKLKTTGSGNTVSFLNELSGKIPAAQFNKYNNGKNGNNLFAQLNRPTMVTIFVKPHEPLNYNLTFLGSYQTGIYGVGVAKFIAYDKVRKNIIVAHPGSGDVELVSVNGAGHVTVPTLTKTIKVFSDVSGGTGIGGMALSSTGVLALTVQMGAKAGKFALYSFDANTGTYKFTKTSDVSTGVMPGKLKFSADGTVVACVDSGSNSISYTSTRIYKGWTKSLTKNSMPPVSTLRSNRVLDPTNLIPTDLEFDITGNTLYVSMQKNNAMASFNFLNKKWSWASTFGFPWGSMDVSDQDKKVDIKGKWDGARVHRMLQPAGITSFSATVKVGAPKTTYVVTANAGGVGSGKRVQDVGTSCGLNKDIVKANVMGRLQVATNASSTPVIANAQRQILCDHLYSYGGRSVSIFEMGFAGMKMIADTGSELEASTARANKAHFNDPTGASGGFDSTSGTTGTAPVSVVTGMVGTNRLLFAGLKVPSGVFMYDVTMPTNPRMLDFHNHRNWTDKSWKVQVSSDGQKIDGPTSAYTGKQMDVCADQIVFVHATESPICAPIVIVGNGDSGSVSIYKVQVTPKPRALSSDLSCNWGTCPDLAKSPMTADQVCNCGKGKCGVPSSAKLLTDAERLSKACKYFKKTNGVCSSTGR